MTATIESPIQGLSQELQRQLSTKRDIMADTRLVSFAPMERGDDPAKLALDIDLPGGVERFGVRRTAHQQIASKLDIGWPLYERLMTNHPDLLVQLANGLLNREPKRRLLRVLDGDVRAFLTDSYRCRDNWDLMEQAVLPVLAERTDVKFSRCELTDTHLYVKVLLPEFELPDPTPKVGTVIHGGLIIKNSEIGWSSLLVAPFTTQYWCANGQVHDVMGQRQRHVGARPKNEAEAWELYSDETLKLDDAAFFAKTRDVITGVLNETVFDTIVGNMAELAGVKVDRAPAAAVEILGRRVGMTQGERGSMMQHLIEGGDLSAFGYVNALTATARDLDIDRQVELEITAGRMIDDAQPWLVEVETAATPKNVLVAA